MVWTTLDRQYVLGPDLLVAPVFSDEEAVDLYLPAGTWTNFFTGEEVEGGWVFKEQYGFFSLPLYVRENANPKLRELIGKYRPTY